MIPDSGGWHVGTGGDVPQNCNNLPGRVKLKVGKTQKQQGAGGKMKIEALKKGKQVEIVKVEGGVEEVF